MGAAEGRAATLVIHPGALGDVLQAVPALRALRRRGPLVFSGQARFGALLRALGLIDAALGFDGLGLEALFAREALPSSLSARLAGFGRVVSWFGARDAVYRENLRDVVGDCVIAPSQPVDESPLTVWQHLLATTCDAASPELDPLGVSPAARDEASRVLAGLGLTRARPLLVVHPGAGGASKQWPAELHARAVAIATRAIDAEVLIHQGPADADAAEPLWRALGGHSARLVEPDLPVLAAVLARAGAYLGGDTGVSHLAAAVGAPAVILFPAATRERWAPWSPTALALAMTDGPDRVAAALGARLRRP